MKIFSDKAFTIYLFSVIVAAVLGILVGKIIRNYEDMEPIIRGILSVATLYLILILFISTSKPLDKLNDPDVQIDLQLIVKHSVMYFFIFIIVTWATQYAIDAVRYLF